MSYSGTALVLLAAGQSRRFGVEDKLLAPLKGRPVLSYPAGLFNRSSEFYRLAITSDHNVCRINILEDSSWDIICNTTPEKGQGTSIALAMKHLLGKPYIDKALIILGDMPFIDEVYLNSIRKALGEYVAIMSQSQGTLCPPAMFNRSVFTSLSKLNDDKGAKSVFMTLPNKTVMKIPKEMAMDIDTIADLKAVQNNAEGIIS